MTYSNNGPVYSNILSKDPCDNCPPGHINWSPWAATSDGPDGYWCTRYGFATNCEIYGDCRNIGSYIFDSAECGAGSPCGCQLWDLFYDRICYLFSSLALSYAWSDTDGEGVDCFRL